MRPCLPRKMWRRGARNWVLLRCILKFVELEETRVGLLDRERSDPVTLSGGEQQRVCIARAIVHRPAVVLADEPTANLDEAYAIEIVGLFRRLHEVGVTLVVSTHSPTAFGDARVRPIELRQGVIVRPREGKA